MYYQYFSGSEANALRGRLLTASATTGWLDWYHGEFWLFSMGFLYISLGLVKTVLHGFGPTCSQNPPYWHSFDENTFEALIATKKSTWIAREDIRQGYLRRGIMTDQLRLVLADQRTMMFLWFSHDGAWEPLQSVLREWLGNGFVLENDLPQYPDKAS